MEKKEGLKSFLFFILGIGSNLLYYFNKSSIFMIIGSIFIYLGLDLNNKNKIKYPDSKIIKIYYYLNAFVFIVFFILFMFYLITLPLNSCK